MSSPAQNTLKRQSPSDARLEKLKKLKASDKCYTSTPLKTDISVSPLSVTSQESPTPAMDPSPQMFNDIDGLEVHIASKTRRRNGISALESMSMLTCGDDEKLTNISFSLGFMSVKYNKLTGDGNLGQFSSDPKRCKYTASLEEGVPEALKQVMPNLAKEQSIGLDQAIAICPLLHPPTTMIQLNRGFPIYEKYFVKKWKRSLFKKLRHHSHLNYGPTLKKLKTLDEMNLFFVIRPPR